VIDFTPVKNASLRPHDLAQLVGVSRVTCSMWLNGHGQPHYLLTDKVQKIVDAVDRAVSAGLLPVPHSVMRRERGYYIKTAVEQAPDRAAGDLT
jgi:DNA-binding XRE family transcriptional regulator